MSVLEFQSEAGRVLGGLQRGLREVLADLPGGAPRRAVDLADVLDLDMNLSWKVIRLVNADEPLAATRFVPGRAGMRILLAAVEAHGGDPAHLESVEGAYDDLQHLIRVHAGNRRTFEMMAAAAGEHAESHGAIELRHRRQAYEANGFLWGVQARLQLSMYILAPSAVAGHLDAAMIRGSYDVRRLRPNVPWRLRRIRRTNDGPVPTAIREPLDASTLDASTADASTAGAPIPFMRAFCSRELPAHEPIERGDGEHIDFRLSDGPVGMTSSFTLVTGEVLRAAGPDRRTETEVEANFGHHARTPCEQLVFDLIVHRDLFAGRAPELAISSELYADGHGPDPCDRLPLEDAFVRGDFDLGRAGLPDVPQHEALMRAAFEPLGWSPDDFVLHRLRLAYPPIPTWIAGRFEL